MCDSPSDNPYLPPQVPSSPAVESGADTWSALLPMITGWSLLGGGSACWAVLLGCYPPTEAQFLCGAGAFLAAAGVATIGYALIGLALTYKPVSDALFGGGMTLILVGGCGAIGFAVIDMLYRAGLLLQDLLY